MFGILSFGAGLVSGEFFWAVYLICEAGFGKVLAGFLGVLNGFLFGEVVFGFVPGGFLLVGETLEWGGVGFGWFVGVWERLIVTTKGHEEVENRGKDDFVLFRVISWSLLSPAAGDDGAMKGHGEARERGRDKFVLFAWMGDPQM